MLITLVWMASTGPGHHPEQPGPAEASKLSLDGPCDPLTGPGQHHDQPDVPEMSANDVFFYAFKLLLQ